MSSVQKQRRPLPAAVIALGLSTIAVPISASANDDLLAMQGDPTQVVMPNLGYAGWNFSSLSQIDATNVASLSVAWALQIGIVDRHEAAPLVVGQTMFIVTPKPNYLLALDLAESGRIIWEFRPDMDVEQAIARGCCGNNTRGLNYVDGKVIYQTLDGQIFAVNATTGELEWRTTVTDMSRGETLVGNGLVVGDLYIAGMAGGERGARGYVSAYNTETGEFEWRYYNVGPDNEVGIGPRFNPFYVDDQQGSVATWFGDSWQRGGGTVWGYFTWDPELNLFYYSTGNCSPYNPDYRREWGVVTLDENGGLIDYRNNWCASQMARDATTGELIWAYNIVPADNWDLDQPINTPLVEMQIAGQPRTVALKAARNGYFYVFDRATGELLMQPWPFAYVDYMTGVDMKSGRPLYDIDRWSFTDVEDRRRYTDYDMPRAAARDDYTGTEVAWCPGTGARNWQNDAFSPRTGLLYVATNTYCATHVVVGGDYVPGEGYELHRFAGPAGAGRDLFGFPTDVVGAITAINPETSEIAWTVDWYVPNDVPVFIAGDVLYQGGTNDGVFRAFNAETGEQLWSYRTGSRFAGSAISYIAPDGRQFVAIVASSAPFDELVTIATAEMDATRYSRSGSTLYVFALPR